ncbi:MAG: hypothetical protein JXJ04_15310 [Spirochaetales bacterium]|nr:hypothetical protein [Spirochaetales bacterium]
MLFVLLVLMFVLLPVFEDLFHIDETMISLDKPQLYSPGRVYEIVTDWGESGRFNQFLLHITWDLLLPVIYFFFLGFFISWFAKRGFLRNSKMQKLNLVSLVALVDLFENISLFLLILVFPAKVDALCWLKTILTIIKYYLFGPGILVALVISIISAVKNKFVIQG